MTRRRPRLTEAQVREVLISGRTLSDLAEECGCSRQLIQQVRSGNSYRHVLPDLPRASNRRTCAACIHATQVMGRSIWRHCGRPVWTCTLGLPDPLEEGIRFANECACYTEAGG